MKVKLVRIDYKENPERKTKPPRKKHKKRVSKTRDCACCGKLTTLKFCSLDCAVEYHVTKTESCWFSDKKTTGHRNISVLIKTFLFRKKYNVSDKKVVLNNTCSNRKCINPEHMSQVKLTPKRVF